MTSEIHVKGKDYKVLKEFKVYHEGWEMDNEGWVAACEGENPVCIMTSHGMPFISSIDELTEFYELHKNAADEMQTALNMLGSPK